jgi:hypothetical protein
LAEQVAVGDERRSCLHDKIFFATSCSGGNASCDFIFRLSLGFVGFSLRVSMMRSTPKNSRFSTVSRKHVQSLLPDNLVSECGERAVTGDERQVLKGALGCQHSVEWVTVIGGIAAGPEGVQVGYGQVFKVVEPDEFVETGYRLPADQEFAEAVLGCDFPRTRRAGQNVVSLVADQIPGVGRQMRIIRPPPE